MSNYITTEIEARDLPKLMEQVLSLAEHPQQKDMLLLSALTAVSYAMPNYIVEHGVPSHRYHPNLMTMVVAPPASGKGVMNIARQIMRHIQEEKRKDNLRAAILCAVEGEEAVEQTALIPGNSSAAAFLQLLRGNEGKGVMIETEMDVLSGAWKHDYANYSYAFRQAWEHETLTQARKKAGEGYIEIEDPQLSVLLSGTYNQLLPMLQSRENGLTSRFVCYKVDEVIPFDERAIHHPDEKADNDKSEVIEAMAKEVYSIYKWMKAQKRECKFVLTSEQATALRNQYSDRYKLAMETIEMPIAFDSVIKRHVVSMLRIGMVLSMVRYWEEMVQGHGGEVVVLPEQMVCDEATFGVMMAMAKTLLIHAGDIMLMLPEEESVMVAETEEEGVPYEELIGSLDQTFQTKDAVAAGEKMGLARRTVEKYLQAAMEDGAVERTGKGEYAKQV